MEIRAGTVGVWEDDFLLFSNGGFDLEAVVSERKANLPVTQSELLKLKILQHPLGIRNYASD
ncbi:hypothetical protein NQZ68_026884 [Dissostichus eleginoides]|nr:hypothetical protein NQZ68_026884 [Dissostichus eleginoides]